MSKFRRTVRINGKRWRRPDTRDAGLLWRPRAAHRAGAAEKELGPMSIMPDPLLTPQQEASVAAIAVTPARLVLTKADGKLLRRNLNRWRG